MNFPSRIDCFAALVACSFSVAALADDVVPAGSSWHYFKGTREASEPDHAAWRQAGFPDSAWSTGPAPFFYGQAFIGTELTDMRGAYSSLYLRREFTVTDPGKVSELVLHALSDDGFVAWINGHEVLRINAPEGEPGFDSVADSPAPDPLAEEAYPLANPGAYLQAGPNVIAVQALNSSKGDSPDFAFNAWMTLTVDTTPPTLVDHLPPEGSKVDALITAEVFFSEPVRGVDAADFLVNGVPATSVTPIAPDHFVFEFDQPPAGTVHFSWAAGHGITDLPSVGNAFAGVDWNVILDPSLARKAISITEFMADNKNGILDEDRDNSDWIELHNSGENPMELLGWSLTDDPADLGKWRFPAVSINGGGYLIVYASQKNKVNPGGKLHTNFKLNAGGDYLALVAPDGEVISDFGPQFPPQTKDVSYGRLPGDETQLGFFSQPTPGARNSEGGDGFAPPVEFSRGSGTVLEPFRLRLGTSDRSAVIRYTTDGRIPTVASSGYAGSIDVTNTIQVRARAFVAGLLPGPLRSESFVMLTNSPAHLANLSSDLPILMISLMTKGSIGDAKSQFVHYSLYEPLNGRASLTNRPTFVSRGGAKVRGSSTGGESKAAWAVHWWDEFDDNAEREILGMPAAAEWVLYAPNEFDPPMIHNAFAHALSRQMGFYSPRTRFVEVYLNRAGIVTSNSYNGVYLLEEHIDRGPHRVDIDKLQPEDVTAPAVTGGYMFKIDRLDPGDGGTPVGGVTLVHVDPKESELKTTQRAPQRQYVKDYFSAFYKAQNTADWRDPVKGYRAYIDEDNWIDYHTHEWLTANVDVLVLSSYFYKPRNGPIMYGPHWDFDRAFGSTDGRDTDPRKWEAGPFFSAVWWSKILGDIDFWQHWVDRWQQLRRNEFSLTNMNALVDQLVAEIRTSQPREHKKWSSFLYRKTTGANGGTYATEIQWMKNWLSNHVAFADSQMTQPPAISQAGGPVVPGTLVTLSGPAGATLYFTTDGSDPRLKGSNSAPSAGAQVYSGPISITAKTRLVVRAQDLTKKQKGGPHTSTPWSMPVAATYTISPPVLTISEIMFHPAKPGDGSPYGAGDFEFIEVRNISSEPVNLAGYHFAEGIQFRFAADGPVKILGPGERAVIVSNQAAFQERHPGVLVAGEFTGNLADEGERLVLRGPLEEPVCDFSYDDHWQRMADGFGFSLVLRDEATPPDQLGDGEKWRLSATVGGSPGIADPVPASPPHVIVNEVLAFAPPGQPAAIELFNPGDTLADVSGWWLSDNTGNPRKVRLPANSIIPAHSYLVVTEASFNLPGGAGFALNTEGDGAWLFSADAEGNLTGWFHGGDFGASESGVSFGRQVTSDGRESLIAQKQVTLNAANAGPLVGPVVVTEVMFHPPLLSGVNNHRDEFIDLKNITAATMPMFDPSTPTNTWHLRGDIEFDFPPDQTLAPGEHAVIVGFSPLLDPLQLVAFRARYGLDGSVPVYGPWHGALANGGGNVSLLHPGLPAGPTTPRGKYVLVDEVHYSTAAPWPDDTGGTGLSLIRRDDTAFADDPMNWTSGLPTPGADDADADGLPDGWETAHNLDPHSADGIDGAAGDPDGDGFSNRQEFLNGTDPRDPASVLRLGAYYDETGLVSFTLAGPATAVFRIEYRDSLDDESWHMLQDVVIPPGEFAVLTRDAVGNAVRYYRLTKP